MKTLRNHIIKEIPILYHIVKILKVQISFLNAGIYFNIK